MIEVIKAGLISTLQDAGRYQYQAMGVPTCGAMDISSWRLANLLVANQPPQACVEMTLQGGVFKFHENALIALSGGDFGPYLDQQSISNHRPYLVRAGQTLRFKPQRQNGARCYLAVAGGFKIPSAMGSLSTDIKNKLGGINGRALQKGDLINLNLKIDDLTANALDQHISHLTLYIPAGLGLQYKRIIRLIRGVHWQLFGQQSQKLLVEQEFSISPQADRMGYRLYGPQLRTHQSKQILSEGVAFGTIQVPNDGQAIILMADHQTTGGYPKIANVASVDLPVLAQYMPGQKLRFELITLAQAQTLLYERETRFANLSRHLNSTLSLAKFICPL